MFPWIAAVLLGALVPAAVSAGFFQTIALLPVTFAVTLGHAVLLGLPIALLYRAKRWQRGSLAIATGFLIGAIPAGILTWPIRPSSRSTMTVNGVVTMVDGVPTLAGWIEYLRFLGVAGSFGALGALAFWLVLRWSGALDEATRALAGPERNNRLAFWLTGVAVAASVLVAMLPSLTRDRSCHNLTRDGRGSVTPMINLDLDISMADWPRLTQVIETFGASRGMSFRNASSSRPGTVEVLSLSACTDDGLNIIINEQRWAPNDYVPVPPGRGVRISVFDLWGDGDWRPLAQDLVIALDTEWHGKLRSVDKGGRLRPILPGVDPLATPPP
ncbi:hypothetical protein KXR53_33315 [Inquilinus limosus]|uniref:hypothetical protein n=1 Tax=Inquilinus limosus TaxID=171674 RepID=UPI003F156A81